jgi:hypothetical protein
MRTTFLGRHTAGAVQPQSGMTSTRRECSAGHLCLGQVRSTSGRWPDIRSSTREVFVLYTESGFRVFVPYRLTAAGSKARGLSPVGRRWCCAVF